MGTIEGFLAWWLRELAEMLPLGLRRVFSAESKAMRLRPQADGETALLLKAGGVVEDVRLDGPAAKAKGPLVVEVPEESLLTLRIGLPVQRLADAADAAALALERHSPFPREETWGGYILHRGMGGHVEADLFIASAEVVAPWAAWSGRAGMQLVAVRPAGRSDVRLRRPNGSQEVGRERFVRPGIVAVGLGALFAIAANPIVQEHRRITDLRAALALEESKMKTVAQVVAETEAAASRVDFLITVRAAYEPRTTTLARLSALLPSDTHLERLTVEGDMARLLGSAASAPALIDLLARDAAFQDARFAAPVRRDPVTGRDRFEVTVRIAPQGSGQGGS